MVQITVGPEVWTVDLKSGKGSIAPEPAPKFDLALTFADEDVLVDLVLGRVRVHRARVLHVFGLGCFSCSHPSPSCRIVGHSSTPPNRS